MVLILLIGSPCTRSIFRILWCIAAQPIDAPLICVTTDQGAGYRAAARLIYRIPAGTTLMLLNGEPLISFVLTTV